MFKGGKIPDNYELYAKVNKQVIDEIVETKKFYNWGNFKKTLFAVRCANEEIKQRFFSECQLHDIHIYMGEHAKKRDIFYCILFGKTLHTSGRYELWSCDEWQTKPNGIFDINGIPIIDYRG